MKFSEKIKEIRKIQNLTQEQFQKKYLFRDLKFFKMLVKSLLGFRFSITLNSIMKKVLLSVIRELLKFYIK